MGQSSSKHHPISAYEAEQMNDLLNYTEPSENVQPRKIRQNDAEFEKSRNIIEVNKAIDFLSGHELIKTATKDDLSNLTTNPLLYLNGNIISSSNPISHIEPPTLSNLPLEKSGRDTDNVIRGMRRIVTHAQMASPLIDDLLEQQANFVYKRFSFANQKAQFNLQESRLSRKLSGMGNDVDQNMMDSQTGKRMSKWLARSGSQDNQSLQMREEVEKLREHLEKSGQLSNKKNRASNLNESGDASRLNDKSLNSQIAEEGGHGVAKVLPGKHGILEEEKKNFIKKNMILTGTKPVSRSISRTQTKSKGPVENRTDRSRNASKSFAKEKEHEHEHAKCIRVANKEKIPVVYKDIQSTSMPRKMSGAKPVSQTNVNKKPVNKVVSKVTSGTSATTAKKKEYVPRKPSIARSYSNLRKIDLNRSQRTQDDNSFEDHSHLNETARTTPLNNVSLYQETELNPINVDLDLKDLLQQSKFVSPYQNFNGNIAHQNYMGNQNDGYLPQQYVVHDNYHDNHYDQYNPGWNPQMQGYEDYDQRGQEGMYNYESQGPYAQYSHPNQSQHYLPNQQYSGRENVFIQNQGDFRDPGYEENNHIMFHNGSPQKDRRMYYAD